MSNAARRFLILLFLAVIAAMLYVTTVASLDRNVLQGGVGLWPDPWFVATLADAYFGFLTFYVWVAYKERRWPARIAWFILIMTLGNFAMAAYVLMQLWHMRPGDPWSRLLLRSEES